MRIFVTVLTFFVWMFLCWYAGVDFLVRHPLNAYIVFCGIVMMVFAYTCPVWRK